MTFSNIVIPAPLGVLDNILLMSPAGVCVHVFASGVSAYKLSTSKRVVSGDLHWMELVRYDLQYNPCTLDCYLYNRFLVSRRSKKEIKVRAHLIKFLP